MWHFYRNLGSPLVEKIFLVWENLACLYFEKETPNGGKTVASTPMILVEMLNDLCPLVGFSPIKWKAYIWLSETSFSVWQLKACYCYHLGPSNHSSHLQLLSLSLKKKKNLVISFFFSRLQAVSNPFFPLCEPDTVIQAAFSLLKVHSFIAVFLGINCSLTRQCSHAPADEMSSRLVFYWLEDIFKDSLNVTDSGWVGRLCGCRCMCMLHWFNLISLNFPACCLQYNWDMTHIVRFAMCQTTSSHLISRLAWYYSAQY